MRRHRLALAQVNNAYGGNRHLPLSVGVLYAFARTRPIALEFEQPVFLYAKEAISKALSRLDPLPDVMALSSYIWNWEWNRALARAIKEVSPTTSIVYGGVHIPDHPEDGWFARHPECDFLLHGEGELSFATFLEEYAGNRDWSKVPGLSTRGLHTERKFPAVEELRSPYLDGVFDHLVPHEESWVSLFETNRGCPY